MSGIDPVPQPDDHIVASSDALSSAPPPLVPSGEPALPSGQAALPEAAAWINRPFPLHPNFGWAILWCIGLLLFTQVPGGVVAVVMIFVSMFLFPQSIRQEDLRDTASILRNPIGLASFGVGIAVAHLLIIGLSLLVLRIIAGRDWSRQVALRRASWSHVGLIILVWPAFSFLANGVGYVIQHYLHVPSFFFQKGGGGDTLEQVLTGWALPPAVLLIAVMPAIGEELWCRAFLGRGLVGKHGFVLGVLCTSFLFGAIHVDPAQGLVAIVMGIGLHYFYLTTRSLLIPMLMHFLNNALAVILPSFPIVARLGQDQNQGERSLALYTGGAVLLFAVCWALYQSRPRLISEDAASAWCPPYPGVALPPPGSGTRLEATPLSQVSLALVAAGLAAFCVGLAMTMQRLG
jgi:membrane protease YdiL (CAAX protease family)